MHGITKGLLNGTINIDAGPRGGTRVESITIGSLNTYDFKTSVEVVCG